MSSNYKQKGTIRLKLHLTSQLLMLSAVSYKGMRAQRAAVATTSSIATATNQTKIESSFKSKQGTLNARGPQILLATPRHSVGTKACIKLRGLEQSRSRASPNCRTPVLTGKLLPVSPPSCRSRNALCFNTYPVQGLCLLLAGNLSTALHGASHYNSYAASSAAKRSRISRWRGT